VDQAGRGVVRSQRLYQMIRQHGSIVDQTLQIVFDDAGAHAFTFG
jgi:hypothetical protein